MIAIQRILDIQIDRQSWNCVSLGCNCVPASVLSRLGCRSFSGPFDWLISQYWAVLDQIEHDFEDFLTQENHEIVEDRDHVFRDKKYEFFYCHDIKEDFETEYKDICEKYCRRIEKFRNEIKQPTVFFRFVLNQEEVNYINANWKYAESLLKQFNQMNKIVYIYRNGLEGLTKEVKSFCSNTDKIVGDVYEMRHLFDKNEEFLIFCAELLPVDLVEKNVNFDNVQNSQRVMTTYARRCVYENIDGLDSLILKGMGVSKEKGVYLWGAGRFGILLAHYLKKRHVAIKGIIDNKLCGKVIEGFDILSFDDICDETSFFITVLDSKMNEEIEEQILKKFPFAKVVKYKDLCEEDI